MCFWSPVIPTVVTNTANNLFYVQPEQVLQMAPNQQTHQHSSHQQSSPQVPLRLPLETTVPLPQISTLAVPFLLDQ